LSKVFTWVAATRGRLALVAAVAYAVLFGAALPVTGWIRTESASPVTDMVIQTAWLSVSLLASTFLAILLGDLLFPNRWRERVILRRPVPEPDLDEDPRAAIRGARSYKLPFFALIVLLIVASAGGIEAITGGFLGEYQRVGYMRSLMRGKDDAAKLELIASLAKKRRRVPVTDAIRGLDAAWRDPTQSAAVRAEALRVLGIQARGLVTSVAAWNRQGTAAGHWEVDALRSLRREVAPALVEALDSLPAQVAKAGAEALGKMRAEVGLPWLRARVRRVADRSPTWFGAVVGLAYMQSLDGLGDLVAASREVQDEEAFRYLAWACGEVARNYEPPVDGTAPPVFGDVIEVYGRALREGPTPIRCAAADTLMKLGDARVGPVLMDAFDAPGAGGACHAYDLDVGEEAPVSLCGDEPLRRRILLAFKYIAKGDQTIARWLDARLADPRASYDDELRANMESLRRSIAPVGDGA